jgi:prepilin-type N-terminal cleavage/methylation domain-containing protein
VTAARGEAGFTLIEVMLASALFVAVAFAGFEAIRQLGSSTALLAQRADAAALAALAAASLRSDALSSAAVWKPASACGDAVEFMQRDAGGTAFVLYAARPPALVRMTAPGPMDPCDPALERRVIVPAIAALHVQRVAATDLPAHADPISGNADGVLFAPAGITGIAADAHTRDVDGTPIAGGNDVVEVTIDADPVVTPIDLVAGNRPSAYTHVLRYTCNGRCEATGPFPEIRGGAFTDCSPGLDFENSPAYYVPATYAAVDGGGGRQRIVITSYSVTGGYTFAFTGPAPVTAERSWPIATWPPASSALAGSIADAYPLDYTQNAVATRGAAQLAADLAEPAAFAAELKACSDMHVDPTYAN